MSMLLKQRDREILDILISDYIATADAIGSRTIAKKHPQHLSPATIRNVMQDLTEMGLLSQPHTSAGRIPTEAALRYYVDTMLKKRELTEAEMEAIKEKCLGDERGVDGVLRRASKVLAAISHYVGLVATPAAPKIIFKQIEFVPLSGRRLLGIFISQDGRVENRLIEVMEELNFSEIERITNYCNSAFVGLSLEDALKKIERELLTERADYDRLLKKAFVYSKQVFAGAQGTDLVVDGEIQLLDAPEFAETGKFKKIVEALEEKSLVLKLLERCKEGEGVRIFIGAESLTKGLGDFSLVGAPYMKDGKVVGTLGVIGPSRMDYSSIVPIVDFTAKIIGDALED